MRRLHRLFSRRHLRNPSILPRFGEISRRRKHERCAYTGCGQPTKEGKPYCPEHVEEHPYIQRLLKQIEKKEAEETRLSQLSSTEITEDSITLQEILNYLRWHGDSAAADIAKALTININVLYLYLDILEKENLVTVKDKGKKRSKMVLLKPELRYPGIAEFSETKRRNPDINVLKGELAQLLSKRRLRRYNPDINVLKGELAQLLSKNPSEENFSLSRPHQQNFLSRLTAQKAPLFPSKQYLDLTGGEEGLVPAILPKDVKGVSPYQTSLPRGAVDFSMLLVGQNPFVIIPEDQQFKYKEAFSSKLLTLLLNLDDINAWEDLWIACSGFRKIGCKGPFDIILISRHNERYKLIDVNLHYGAESGELVVRHLGPQGELTISIPQDAYEYKRTEERIERLPYFFPIMLYK